MTRLKSIYWNDPTIVVATILDLAIYHMFSFHYNVIRTNFDCCLLYSDTDSLLYATKSEDFDTELSQIQQSVLCYFEFSKHRPHHFLYNTFNKKVVLKDKDELAGDYVNDFISLKQKLYSTLSKSKFILLLNKIMNFCIKICNGLVGIWKVLNSIIVTKVVSNHNTTYFFSFHSFFLLGCRKLSAKRLKRAAQQHFCHVKFLHTLSTGNHLRSDNTRIVSDSHRLQTVTANKICLSALNNKRYILTDGTKTLPFGHYEIDD